MTFDEASELSKQEFCERVAELYKQFPENKSRISKELGITRDELESFDVLKPLFEQLREEMLDDIAERIFRCASGKGDANFNLANAIRVLSTYRQEWGTKKIPKKEKTKVAGTEEEKQFKQVLEKMGRTDGTANGAGRVIIRT